MRSVPNAAGALVPLFLASLALRPQLIGIGPLLPFIQDSLAIPHAVGGLVAAIPVFLMSIFALLDAWCIGSGSDPR